VLGTIIHSGPVYVGTPKSGYVYDDYLAFADSNSGRSPRIYVGANDGMLHALDAASGREAFAYIPSMVMGNLTLLTANPYNHVYYVDGFLTAEDAQFGSSWHTVLVGGLGAGGKGYYALDVTNTATGTEAAAAGKILWEFHSGVAGAANLGYSYSYSRPSVVRLENGDWVAVVGNGYLSATGAASLYLLDIETGTVVREIVVPDLDANGLSSPTVIDADGYADTAYAGDLNGNLWKFDINNGSVAFGGAPLFQTAISGGVRQAITTAPDVGHHPKGGVMVYAGTGRLFSTLDAADESTQAVYGIWDNDTGPVALAELVVQRLKSVEHASGESVRTATALKPDWTFHRCWVTPTEIVGATALDKGERVIQDILLRDGRISFMSVDPTITSGDNYLMQLDALAGGGPDKIIIDINADGDLTIADNVDGNGDGVTEDVREDRVVGQYQNFGLASRPIAGVLGGSKDAALINHLAAISPGVTGNPDDPGLLGGHFDLDTSSQIYPFSGGDTDGHVHEWDDKHDATTIDYFDLPLEGDKKKLFMINDTVNAVLQNDLFLLTVTNTWLSPGGVLEINGTSLSVARYNNLFKSYLTDTLAEGESFPVYKLDPPTASERDAGVVQLISLKLSFDAFAIISGDLMPTETGCVRGNDRGKLGEYRNGALMLQALDARDVGGGFVLDVPTKRYVAGSTAVNSDHLYATENLFWESTLFWHWKDGCYHEAEWAPAYDACIVQGLGGCTIGTSAEEEEKSKKKKKKKKKGEPDPVPPGFPAPPPGVETDPSHSVTTTTVSGASDLGRLFWKELIPEE
jgi:outer membrane protein assembly factor BamB